MSATVTEYPRYVYRLTFPNGMVYIGIANAVERRWANQGIGYKGQKVYEAIKEFGWDNVQKEILLYIESNERLVRDVESTLIKQYGKRCYNDFDNDGLDPTAVIGGTAHERQKGDIYAAFEIFVAMCNRQKDKVFCKAVNKTIDDGLEGFKKIEQLADELGVQILLIKRDDVEVSMRV